MLRAIHITSLAALLAPCLALAEPPKMLKLADVQERLALPALEASTNLVEISDGTNSVVFHPGYRRAAVNGIAVWLNEPADPDYKCVLQIARPDLERMLEPILKAVRPAPGNDGDQCIEAWKGTNGVVFIDAGHGGDDCGAVSAATGQKEKDLVLDISLRLGALLSDMGHEVAYSRTNDTFISLDQRSDMARDANAALFVSVHANTTAGAAARGIETFTLSMSGFDSTSGDSTISKKEWPGNAFDARSSVLGYFIQSAVNTERGDADRGLRHARFQVLRRAPCPAVLVECGFLSNAAENMSLESPRYRQRIAVAIAKAVFAAMERLVPEPQTTNH